MQMRVAPYYSPEVVERMRTVMELHTGLFVSPQTRGYVLLGAVAFALFVGGFMADGVLTPTYVFAFVPLFPCLIFTLFDTFSSKATYLPRAEWLAGTDTTHRAIKESWVRFFTWALWTVVVVLTPLLLEGLNTVYASCVTTLIAVWLVAVIVAQYLGQESVMRPISLPGIAGYLTGPGARVAEPIDLESNGDDSSFGGVTSPHEDADEILDQQQGTQRQMSVRPSLRGSPQTAAKQGLLLVEDDVGLPGTHVQIPDRDDDDMGDIGTTVDMRRLDAALAEH
jgi:hypothetical protein